MENRDKLIILINKILDVQEQDKHFIDLQFRNIANDDIDIYVMKDGFKSNKNYDLIEYFNRNDNEAIDEMIDYFDKLLEESNE